ncbi:Mediator of RNA polymerase II transcription subunit 13 [Fulvia fulva]|uniref:Mediator of RNA polymerase II transcription subunit 13 n=1 Tax=Passalora fulva TaxID=5499 RepID=A0A9Q8L682_PASFU|nr:Mediator of RNA polymerase II transcription subunit 13 [Fulvia fulva]KAK4637233.1 Mediator of RNA polymerase II transcription subunit 13 [Fulvia fulva]UJO11605.1 Mediator of RNA polymerase II transcription subunit 13 [Fulvia fulva]
MDFLQRCTTNVHAVHHISDTPYVQYQYSWKNDRLRVAEALGHIRNTLTYLRARNVLCTGVAEHLWIFGHLEDETKHRLDAVHQALVLVDSGTLENESPNTPVLGHTTRDLFLEAIEHALAFRLARDTNVIHVGPWTWLYMPTELDDEDGQDRTLVTMSVKGSESDTLYLVPKFFPSSWQPLEHVGADDAHTLVLAPMGHLARPVIQDADPATANRAWRDQLVAALASKNIHLSTEDEWQTVEMIDGPSEGVFDWPLRLCLAPRVSQAYHSDLHAPKTDWRSWFAGLSNQQTFLNPLGLAEAWFNGASERQRVQPDHSPAQMGELDDALPSSVPIEGQDASVSSPFNQRQFDQQAAMAGIYPTPPDGLAQSQATAQPILATTPSVANAEQTATIIETLPTSDEVPKESERSAAEHADFQVGPEDLFGDVGEIGFGDNDVGDADFSFFDEPDDEAMMVDDTEIALPASTPAQKLADIGLTDIEEKTMLAPVDSSLLLQDGRMASGTDHASDGVAESTAVQQMAALSPPKVTYEKPLSPFGIRERLLPPPVPASMVQPDVRREVERRRSSTFQPVGFRAGFDLGSKYASVGTQHGKQHSSASLPKAPSIGLTPMRKKSRAIKLDRGASRFDTEDDTESEEDSFESSSSESDAELPPRLPWDNRKRKRVIDGTKPEREQDVMCSEDGPRDGLLEVHTNETLLGILKPCTGVSDKVDLISTMCTSSHEAQTQRRYRSCHALLGSPGEEVLWPSIEETYDFRKDDLIYVAQIVSEHSATALGDVHLVNTGYHGLQRCIETAFNETLPISEPQELSQVALMREPPPRAMPNAGKGPQGQPRPPQRSDSSMVGPDYFSLPPPYVKVQRGSDSFEMLPTSLPFWEPLGLGPTGGPKDVQAFCVFPCNADLQRAVRHFLTDVGTAYESCKYGSHVHTRTIDSKDELDKYQDGMTPVKLDTDMSIVGAFKAYAQACAQLGKALASIGPHENERATVIYMLNPFTNKQALHHLSACFWLLFKAYRESLSKAQKNHSGSDIVLQLVPIDLVASFDTMVVLDSRQAMAIAREVYDRCPPSSTLSAGGDSAVLPILSAPSVELASAAPKRIGFQLAAEPPSHLLHEGSILHLAYACSKDGQWVTAAWVDNTGLYQSTVAYSLRGKSLAEPAEEVVERTYEILAARKVTWRLFIVTHQGLDQSISQCWRSLAKPRAQPLCVTLSTVQLEPALVALSPASPTDGHLKDGSQDGGFLTPASTPQGNNFTSSPDVSGQSNAPPTPAPSDTTASALEVEMETHLVDTTDETWGALISPTFSSFIADVGLANALIFKRGGGGEAAHVTATGSRHSLPGMGVTLHWTIQVKPNGAIDEGTVKQAELTLREVVKMYRNLALLTKAKGLDRGRAVCAPLPVAAAMLGAEGLDGLLPAIQ